MSKWDKYRLSVKPVKKTASAIVYTGPCIFHGFLLGTDGVNDPTITVYNNISAAGEEVVPTTVFDASALGLNGVSGMYALCTIGIYIEIASAGTCEAVVQYAPCPYQVGELWK
jgi:hypothetical protein